MYQSQYSLIKSNDNLIYKNNMRAIRKYYPQYSDLIERTKVNKEYKAVIAGKENKFNILNIKNNSLFYEPNSPDDEIKSQMEALQLRNVKIALFLGFGLGYEVDYFARFISENQGTQYFLIVEKDVELFKIALTYIDYSPMLENPNIGLFLGEKEEEMLVVFQNYFIKRGSLVYFIKCVKPIYHQSSMDLNGGYYLSVLKQLRESILYFLKFYGNDPHDSLIGIENMLENINEIIANPGINLLYNKFRGKPAVVVSTGPSLNKNKHLLKGLEDKALILCPDASLRILLDMGVKPHFVTALERVPITAELIKGFEKEQVEDVYYAACPVIRNEAYQYYPGPRVIVYRNFDHFKWLGVDRGILEIQQSSGNMAYKIADAMGCDPIILIGQDLAFGEDGISHAKGASLGEKQMEIRNDEIEVMGNNGKMIKTLKVWDMFRRGYEIDISKASSKCINSTEGGAFINGTTLMPFKEAIETYIDESFYPLDNIKDILSQFTNDNVHDDYDRIKKLIDKTIIDLDYMMEQCKEGIKKIKNNESKYQAVINDGEVDFEVEILSNEDLSHKINIHNTQPTMQLFLMHIIQSFNIKFEVDVNALWDKYDERAKVIAEITLAHPKWYAVICDIIDIAKGSLVKAKDKIETLHLDCEAEKIYV